MVYKWIQNVAAEVSGTKARAPQLDGLRGFAILMVLTVHSWGYAKAPEIKLFSQKVNLTFFPQMALLGVDLFFVLSGYLLFTQVLEKKPMCHFWKYYSDFISRRFFRIFPVYCLFLVALFTFIPTTSPLLRLNSYGALGNLSYHLFFLHNFKSDYLYTFPYIWSLATEMQFYVLFPFIAWLLLKKPQIVWPLLWLFAVGVVVVFFYYRDRLPFQFDISFPYRLNQFLVGCGVAYLVFRLRDRGAQFKRSLFFTKICPFVGFFLLLFLMWIGRQRLIGIIQPDFSFRGLVGCYIWSALVAISFGLILFHAVNSKNGILGRIYSNRFLGILGIVSYGIFIWHNPILEYLSKTGPINRIESLQLRALVLFLIIFVVSGMVGILSYVFIESRFLRKPLPKLKPGEKEETSLRPIQNIATARKGI